MKSFFSLLVICFLIYSCKTQQSKPYPEFYTYAPSHNQIAVLPFQVNFNEDYMVVSSRRSNFPNINDYWMEQSRVAGLDMQKSFFIDLAKLTQKGKMQIAIQDYLSTRKKLESAGIGYSEIANYDKGELGRILGVDAVFWGKTLVNASSNSFGYPRPNDGVQTEIQLYNSQNGALLWKDSESQRPSIYTDTPSRLGYQSLQTLAKQQPYYNTQKR